MSPTAPDRSTVLLGTPGSRERIDTPALVLDLDAFEHNVALMAETCRRAGVGLRPHAKTHKCSTIARRQIEAGALGIGCATIDEAEVMVAAGLPGVLITSPLVTDGKIARLMQLVSQGGDVMVVADHPQNVAALDAAATAAGATLRVLVDLDLGHHRTGVAGVAEGVRLAREIASWRALRFAGVQAYGGHLQHIADHAERLAATRAADGRVADLVRELTAADLAPAIVTGAGTGTHRMNASGSPFTELQAGSYIVMDAEYGGIEYAPGEAWPFRPALFVAVAVTSANVPGSVTTDGGTKAFALNGPRPRVASGPLAGAPYEFSGDEHGRIALPDGRAAPALGTVLECTVPHVDPTIAHYDAIHCVRGDRLVEVWPVDARGRRPAAAA
ncbi:DSD1 family PLP-dependent enzyme [Rhodoplanes sp. TEM]|uniref:DSD1 family PLP-dependent enzyme n=1 Tax=Rhodoplanes tepidamans TaxID=200616 RepID=A0ABT5JE72_RHOTP|nr:MULTISPECIES: DSD1 family PLP-dependent enzyme [Rhodoplanes]MDC7787916.1 DSD1 family PLP-dependent enzyme [Rhodoplanes tepidamans]MDC7987808.1 DSD1 family PLP-dependent enzyme [Rhodoplanes sp. TEM]MDQ0354839.1 D-serine deaminase-like pyridoxal phosphate-dependent protein [Rhodoplanes tepidamans]